MTSAAVLIVCGQSNAHGHGQQLAPHDRLTTPLRNVFGLPRQFNQSLSRDRVVWRGYTSDGMNLGEEQDHTVCLATETARLWQAEVDAGNPRGLPDLYILQISIGAQGVTERFMWYPDRPPRLKPGKLGTVDISLYPYTCHLLRLAFADLRAQGKQPVPLALHWIGGEEEAGVPLTELTGLRSIYERLFQGFRAAIGQECPILLYRDLSGNGVQRQGYALDSYFYVRGVFEELAAAGPDIRIRSAADSPYWRDDAQDNGIFAEDCVHYTADVQRWFARQAMADAYARLLSVKNSGGAVR